MGHHLDVSSKLHEVIQLITTLLPGKRLLSVHTQAQLIAYVHTFHVVCSNFYGFNILYLH